MILSYPNKIAPYSSTNAPAYYLGAKIPLALIAINLIAATEIMTGDELPHFLAIFHATFCIISLYIVYLYQTKKLETE